MKQMAIDMAFQNPDVMTRVVWMGPVPIITTGCTRDIEKILGSSKQLDKGFFYRMLRPWLGNGLLLNKGQSWHHRRKLLTPSFHFTILTSFVDIFNEKAQILAKKLSDLAGSKPVDIFPLVTNCTLDVICGTAMGIDIGAQKGNNSEYCQAIIEMSDVIQERQKYPWLWIDAIYNLLPNGRKHKRYLEILHGMTQSVIQERMKEKSRQNGTKSEKSVANGNPTKKKKRAFLDLLLDLHEENSNFTLDEVREEVDTFMFEGHDTTSASISWTLFMIGHHPKVQEKVHQELDRVFGDDKERSITTDDIAKLKYLGYVIKETLRLYPSVPMIARQLEENTTLSGNFVPKGTVVLVGIYFMQRSGVYFSNPDEFNPDNFLPENVEGRDPFSYIPFSAGPRNCIGQKFATMEEKVILATLLRKLEFRSLQSIDDVTPIGNLILRPYDGISMEVKLRQ
ncbi:putative cytochrome P450 4V2 [Apostichopus japonicus]|uniref:Putative cytochrome P450 4V2 n=1 Tax=Stichopus japonicus TaxID=307972 RepID=A0A2G8KS13_STIJA|nr:putative cytochrome P450 4V2 [Apostichopus japonicus]